jgi:hypothetical protein
MHLDDAADRKSAYFDKSDVAEVPRFENIGKRREWRRRPMIDL